MRPVRVMIADDESFACHYLQVLLSKYPNIQLVAVARDGREAINLLHSEEIDLVFMDVLMPGINGIDMLKQLNKVSALTPPLFVMHTAYEQFACAAFDHKAFAYLLKPLSPQKLHQTLQDVYTVLQRKMCVSLQQQHPRLQFQQGTQHVFLDEQEIILLQAAGNYVCVKTRHDSLIVREPLKVLRLRLPRVFVQVHRSVVVNLLHVKKLTQASVCKLTMSDESTVTLSRRYKNQWQGLLGD